jgi:hypothetical protein
MNDNQFDELLSGKPATLEEFKDLYKTTVYDLRHAVRLQDGKAIEAVTKAFEGWLQQILDSIPEGKKLVLRTMGCGDSIVWLPDDYESKIELPKYDGTDTQTVEFLCTPVTTDLATHGDKENI